MTYGRVLRAGHGFYIDGAAVSHLAELVRGDCGQECPLIRPFGAPSPQGEKGQTALVADSIRHRP
jgi:hypothetical protein